MQVITGGQKGKAKSRVGKAAGPASECARAVLETIPNVMWFVRRHLRKRRASGLSVPQFRVMLMAEKCSKLQLSGISNQLGVSMPTASRIVSGLVEKGFLNRAETDGDRRCRPIHLTGTGQAALNQAWNGTHEAMAQALSDLSATECRHLTEAMLRLGAKVAAAPED